MPVETGIKLLVGNETRMVRVREGNTFHDIAALAGRDVPKTEYTNSDSDHKIGYTEAEFEDAILNLI